MARNINIGLDIGISSVGWAVVDADEFKIIDAGSRLFPEAGSSGTADKRIKKGAAYRRIKRGIRRGYRRWKLRREDFLALLKEYNLNFNLKDLNVDLIVERNKGLEEKISESTFIKILYFNLKNRGIFNLKDENKNDENQEELTLEQIKKIESQIPCKLLLENLKNNGKARGSENKFTHKKLEEEINLIYNTQKKLNIFSKIDDNFLKRYLEIFNRKREYWQGPGKGSSFGWDGDQDKFYDNLIGKDTYDRNELRAPKLGFHANIFDLLNVLNKIELDETGRKISKKKKKNINWVNNKNLAKMLNCEEDKIGFRKKKNEEPNYKKIKALLYFKGALEKAKLKLDWLKLENIELLDEIVVKLTYAQSFDNAKKELEKLFEKYNNVNIDDTNLVIEALSEIYSKFKSSHRLSNKTIKMVTKIMWEESKNSTQILTEMGKKPDYIIPFPKSKYVPILKQNICEMYISPVVKRSLIQSLNVLKEIQIQFRDDKICEINIELAREKNTAEYKKFIKDSQEKNEKNKKLIEGYDEIKLSESQLKKMRLAYEQNYKCLYCGEEIDQSKLLNDEFLYEIDHIIPESLSFDSSLYNLVLVHNSENNKKGKRTAYEYIKSPDSKISYELYKRIIIDFLNFNLKNQLVSKKYILNKVYNHLLNEIDFNDPNMKRDFISRNLNDTRHVTSEIKAYIENYKKENNLDFKINSINGRYTYFLRNNVFHLSKKDRNIYNHHAIDAIMIAYSNFLQKDITKLKDNKIYSKKYSSKKVEIEKFDYKYSKLQIRKNNKQFHDETLFSIRKIENNKYKIIKKVDLYSSSSNEIKILSKIFETFEYKSLMEEYDQNTFNYLKEIFNKFKPESIQSILEEDGKQAEIKVKNPFEFYVTYKNNNKKLVLQKNKSNPNLNPIIKKIKFTGSSKVSKIFDISKKYDIKKKNTVIGFTSMNPLRIDVFKSRLTNKYGAFAVNINQLEGIDSKSGELIIDNKKYNQKKLDEKINSDYEFLFSLTPHGDMIYMKYPKEGYDENGKILQVDGFPESNKILLHEIDRYIKTRFSVSEIIEFKKVHLNILGNKKKFIEKE